MALSRAFILPCVRARVVAQHESYPPFVTRETISEIIQPAALGADAGPRGAIVLAQLASR